MMNHKSHSNALPSRGQKNLMYRMTQSDDKIEMSHEPKKNTIAP